MIKILYESYWGRGMIDNPYAIFLELMSRERYRAFTHVWVLDDFEKISLLCGNIEKILMYGLFYLEVMSIFTNWQVRNI